MLLIGLSLFFHSTRLYCNAVSSSQDLFNHLLVHSARTKNHQHLSKDGNLKEHWRDQGKPVVSARLCFQCVSASYEERYPRNEAVRMPNKHVLARAITSDAFSTRRHFTWRNFPSKPLFNATKVTNADKVGIASDTTSSKSNFAGQGATQCFSHQLCNPIGDNPAAFVLQLAKHSLLENRLRS